MPCKLWARSIWAIREPCKWKFFVGKLLNNDSFSDSESEARQNSFWREDWSCASMLTCCSFVLLKFSGDKTFLAFAFLHQIKYFPAILGISPRICNNIFLCYTTAFVSQSGIKFSTSSSYSNVWVISSQDHELGLLQVIESRLILLLLFSVSWVSVILPSLVLNPTRKPLSFNNHMLFSEFIWRWLWEWLGGKANWQRLTHTLLGIKSLDEEASPNLIGKQSTLCDAQILQFQPYSWALVTLISVEVL